MKATNGQKMRTGIFSIIGLFLLIGAVFLIGKTKNMFGDTFHIYGTFKNVGGLQVGNNVRFVGTNIGTVTGITIVTDTLARVDMIINEKVHPFIKNDAIASIGSDGLMGDKLISIASTSGNAVVIKSGEKITTQDPADFAEIISRVQRIASNAEVITDGLAGIATQISSGKGNIGRLIYDDKLSKNLDASMSNMKSGTEGFKENMTAMKHNFLLKGYYKKKEQKKQEAADKALQDTQKQPATDPQPDTKAARKAAKKAKKDSKTDSQ